MTAQPYITTMKMYCLDMERPIIYFNILILEMVLSCNLYFTLIVQTIKCFLLLFNGTNTELNIYIEYLISQSLTSYPTFQLLQVKLSLSFF